MFRPFSPLLGQVHCNFVKNRFCCELLSAFKSPSEQNKKKLRKENCFATGHIELCTKQIYRCVNVFYLGRSPRVVGGSQLAVLGGSLKFKETNTWFKLCSLYVCSACLSGILNKYFQWFVFPGKLKLWGKTCDAHRCAPNCKNYFYFRPLK